MKLAVRIYRPKSGPFAALLFKPPALTGAPEPVLAPLRGKGTLFSAEAPAELCHAGNNSRWEIWLVGRYGKSLGRIGDFTIVGCP